MADIDFLPTEYWKRRATQRDQWYLLGIGASAMILLVGSIVREARESANLRSQLITVETEYADALAEIADAEWLAKRRDSMAADANFHSLIRAHPSLSRALVAVSTSCPLRLTLNSIRIKPDRSARQEQKPDRVRLSLANAGPAADPGVEQLERFAADSERTIFLVELTGIAESDIEVAELIERLEQSECFADVRLAFTDAQSTGGSNIREFKVQCRLAQVL